MSKLSILAISFISFYTPQFLYAAKNVVTGVIKRPPATTTTSLSEATTAAGICATCEAAKTSAAAQAQKLRDQVQAPQKINTNDKEIYKSETDLDSYLHMYRKGCQPDNDVHSYNNKYLNEYKKYIKVAAEEFHIPYAALACKIFRESQFDHNAFSGKALGLGQFTAETRETITRIVSDNELTDKNLEDLQSLEDKVKANKKLSHEEYRRHEYYIRKKLNNDLKKNWQNYFTKLRGAEENKKSEHPIFYTPKIFSDLGAKVASISVAATALYFSQLRNMKIGGEAKPGQDELDSSLVISGAYNMGPGNAIRFIKAYAKDNSPKEYVAALSRLQETKDYMESIRRCMQKSDVDGPVVRAYNRNKGTHIAKTQAPCKGDAK